MLDEKSVSRVILLYVQCLFDTQIFVAESCTLPCRSRGVGASQNAMTVGSAAALGGTVAEASLVVRRASGSAHQVAPLIAAHAWKRIDGRRAARFHSTSEPERRDRAEVASERRATKRGWRVASRPGNATCY